MFGDYTEFLYLDLIIALWGGRDYTAGGGRRRRKGRWLNWARARLFF